MAHDVFISYASGDKAIAETVCSILERHQLRCWFAPRNILPGQEYGEAIVDAIAGCRALVLVLSSRSNESEQVEREAERALAKRIRIIPFRIEDVKPSKNLEYFISACQWLDAFTPPLEAHVVTLVDALLGTPPPTSLQREPSSTVAKPNRARTYLALAAGIIVLALAVFAYFRPRPLDPEQARVKLTTLGLKYTPEDFARSAENDDAIAVNLFLAAGMDPNNALHTVIFGERYDLLDALLGQRPSVTLLNSALYDAVRFARIDIVQKLLTLGADANEGILLAALDGHTAKARLLLDAGADVDRRHEGYDMLAGQTPLMIAIRGHHKDTVLLLLDRGADVNAKAADGLTPLQMAVEQKAPPEIVRTLLSKGADAKAAGMKVEDLPH